MLEQFQWRAWHDGQHLQLSAVSVFVLIPQQMLHFIVRGLLAVVSLVLLLCCNLGSVSLMSSVTSICIVCGHTCY